MTMKWSVRCGVPAVVTAASALMAGNPGKEPSGGSMPPGKAPTVNYVVASPRAYLAGGATERTIGYGAMTGAVQDFARPVLAKARLMEVPVGTRVIFSLGPEGDVVLPINEGIGN